MAIHMKHAKKTVRKECRFTPEFKAKLAKRAKRLNISENEMLERSFNDNAEWAEMSPENRVRLKEEAERTKTTRLAVLEKLISNHFAAK